MFSLMWNKAITNTVNGFDVNRFFPAVTELSSQVRHHLGCITSKVVIRAPNSCAKLLWGQHNSRIAAKVF